MMRCQLIGGKENTSLLFTRMTMNDRQRFFMVDTGSDLSYLFIKPLRCTLHKERRTVIWLHGTQQAVRLEYDRFNYWYAPRPQAIERMEREFSLTIAGILGVDYLVAHKIVLDFGQL